MSKSNFIIVTTPTVAGYKIKKVLGVVTSLAPRTRVAGGMRARAKPKDYEEHHFPIEMLAEYLPYAINFEITEGEFKNG